MSEKEPPYVIDDEPTCEHCGENWDDVGESISDCGTSYCLTCYKSMYDVSDEFSQMIKEEVKEAKIKYYQAKLDELTKKG